MAEAGETERTSGADSVAAVAADAVHQRLWRLMARLNERIAATVDQGYHALTLAAAEAIRVEIGDGATVILLDVPGQGRPVTAYAHVNAARRDRVAELLAEMGDEQLTAWVRDFGDGPIRLFGRLDSDRGQSDNGQQFRSYIEELEMASVAYAPLRHPDNRIRGLLICTRDHGSAEFTKTDLDVILHAAHTTSLLIDITASRAAERAANRYWSTAFDAPVIGKTVLDADRNIVRVNEVAAEIAGLSRWEMLGVRFPEWVDPDIAVEDVNDIERAGLGLPVPPRIREIKREDGTSRFIQRVLSAVFDDAGKAELFHLQFTDITTLRDAEQKVSALAEQRRLLLTQLVSAEQAERHRIAQDVHDDSIQLLAAAQLRMQLLVNQLAKTSESTEARVAADIVSGLLSTAQRRLRQLLLDLEPPAAPTAAGRSLAQSLNQVASNFFDGTGTQVVVTGALEDLPDEVASVFYRATREALSNALRHADADVVTVELSTQDGCWRVTVVDDGIGVPDQVQSAPGHLGLRSMYSRVEALGGSCSVRPHPIAGTEVVLAIPCTG